MPRPIRPDGELTIREAVIRRARALGYTAHRLAIEVRGVSESQLYRYFAGTSDLSGRRLDRVLAALNLVVRVVRHPPPRAALALMRVRVNAGGLRVRLPGPFSYMIFPLTHPPRPA